MANKGGFSWKRASGISGAKSGFSRKTGVPLSKSGRQRKAGAAAGCFSFVCIPIIILVLFIVSILFFI